MAEIHVTTAWIAEWQQTGRPPLRINACTICKMLEYLFWPNFWKVLKKRTAQLGTNSLSCLNGILPAGKFCAQQHKKLLAARQTPARQCYKDDSQLCPLIARPSCNTLSLCYLKHTQNTTKAELFKILMK